MDTNSCIRAEAIIQRTSVRAGGIGGSGGSAEQDLATARHALAAQAAG